MNKNNLNHIYNIATLLVVIILVSLSAIYQNENYLLNQKYMNNCKLVWTISRKNYQLKILPYFDRKMNYTELVYWIEDVLDYMPIQIPEGEEFHHLDDPIEILNYKKGRCQEYTYLYVAACWAMGYEARVVVSIKPDDHSWAEVNINEKWIHVDVTNHYWNDPYRRYDQGHNIKKVIAFEPFSYFDVTESYISLENK